jgi:hypothetical protein
MPLSDRAERITKEHIENMLIKLGEIHDLAKSGGDNLQHFIQSRVDTARKALKDIDERL